MISPKKLNDHNKYEVHHSVQDVASVCCFFSAYRYQAMIGPSQTKKRLACRSFTGNSCFIIFNLALMTAGIIMLYNKYRD